MEGAKNIRISTPCYWKVYSVYYKNENKFDKLIADKRVEIKALEGEIIEIGKQLKRPKFRKNVTKKIF